MTKYIWHVIVLLSVFLVFGSITDVLPFRFFEVVGFVSGLVSVQQAVEKNRWTWLTGIVNSVAFLILFWPAGLYANVILQAIFIAQGVWGWTLWKKSNTEATFSTQTMFLSILLVMIPATLVAMRITSLAGWAVPFWDSLTAVMSIFATYLLGKKYIQTWYLWITVDVIYIFLFAHQQLYLMSALYVAFLYLATTGLLSWNKEVQKKVAHVPS